MDFELSVITINTILAYIIICIGLFVYYICVSRKISRRANELNQYFEDNVIKIGKIAGISVEELENYRKSKG